METIIFYAQKFLSNTLLHIVLGLWFQVFLFIVLFSEKF